MTMRDSKDSLKLNEGSGEKVEEWIQRREALLRQGKKTYKAFRKGECYSCVELSWVLPNNQDFVEEKKSEGYAALEIGCNFQEAAGPNKPTTGIKDIGLVIKADSQEEAEAKVRNYYKEQGATPPSPSAAPQPAPDEHGSGG